MTLLSDDQIIQRLLFSGEPDCKEKLRLFLRYLKYKGQLNSVGSGSGSLDSAGSGSIARNSNFNGNGNISSNSNIGRYSGAIAAANYLSAPTTTANYLSAPNALNTITSFDGRITRSKSPLLSGNPVDTASKVAPTKSGRRGRKPKTIKQASPRKQIESGKRPRGRPRKYRILEKENAVNLKIENQNEEQQQNQQREDVESDSLTVSSTASPRALQSSVQSSMDSSLDSPSSPETRNSLRGEAEILSGIGRFLTPSTTVN